MTNQFSSYIYFENSKTSYIRTTIFGVRLEVKVLKLLLFEKILLSVCK